VDVGLYGKLPTHGDFLRRRVADDFVAAWDAWLQRCILESRAALGEQWLETYLTSPVWRFAFGPRVCGTAAVAGLLVPSVDRVGRNFPLTVVWPTPVEFSTLEVPLRFREGFESAEQLILDTLAQEQLDFAAFDRQVMELASYFEAPLGGEGLRLTGVAAQSVLNRLPRPQCIPLSAAAALEAPALQLLGGHLDRQEPALALWWTDGSAAVDPSWLVSRGLPEPASYSAMLDGAWLDAGWDLAETEPDGATTLVRSAGASAAPSCTAQSVTAPRVTAAGLTERGPVRGTNQDALLDLGDRGLWAVADGMGGLSDGEIASRMVCDALAEAPVLTDLDAQIEAVIARLREVNEYLRRVADRLAKAVHSGSTVVVLVIRGKECAVLWAGDSRAYRLRDGLISQLTTDHVAVSAANAGREEAEAITRAVGAEASLELDVVRSDVRVHDRFLLCSDGIGRALDVHALARVLPGRAPGVTCADLIAQAIAAGSQDNMTAVVVDCAEPEDTSTGAAVALGGT
jgi:type VI secretion system protein ImpM